MRAAILQYSSSVLLFLTVWFLWPLELDGYLLGKEGRALVPDYAMVNAHYISVKESHVEMESFAKDTSFDLIQHKMEAKNTTSHFYNQLNEKTTVTSDTAYYFMDDRKMLLSGNVKSVAADGFEMRTAAAEYYVNKKFFVAPVPVEGDTKDKSVKIWGNRAESYLDTHKLQLLGDARAEYFAPKRGLTKIRGDRADLDRDAEELNFLKNVKVEQDKIVATGQQSKLFYSKEIKGVRYMSILEDVKIQEQGGRYTRSQVAEFFAPTDTIVLTGFPSVYDGDDAVTGDKITLYRSTGVVEVTAVNAAAKQRRSEHELKKTIRNSKEDEELIP